MAIEGGPSMSKQIPLFRERGRPGDEEWPNERVVGWLDDNGWTSAAHRNVQGQQFLDLTMEDLNDLLPGSRDDERRLLLQNIHTLRTSIPSSRYEGVTTTPTSLSYDRPFRDTPEMVAYQQRLQARPSPSIPSRIANPYYAIPTRQQQLGTPDYEYGGQRPLIPERTSSTSEDIPRLMESIQVPQIMPLTTMPRGRPSNSYLSNLPPSNGRYSGNTGGSAASIAGDWMRNQNGPRYPADPERGWKMAGSRVQVAPTPPLAPAPAPTPTPTPPAAAPPRLREYPIQVTKDSDVYFRLIITDTNDPQYIKYLILKKMSFDVGSDKYQFFHENGNRPDLALSDDELLHVCRNSDDSMTKHILVKLLDAPSDNYRNDYVPKSSPHPFRSGYQRPYGAPNDTSPTQTARQSPYGDTYDTSSRILGHSQPERASPVSTVSGFQLTDPPAPQLEDPTYIMPEYQRTLGTPSDEYRDDSGYFERNYKRSSGRSTASTEHSTSSDQATTPSNYAHTEMWIVPPQTTSVERPKPLESLWAVPPRLQPSYSGKTNQPFTEMPMASKSTPALGSLSRPQSTSSDKSIASTNEVPPTVSLWAVPPRPQSTCSEKSTGSTNEAPATVSLWAVPPRPQSSTSDRTDNSYVETPITAKPITPTVSLWAVPPRSQTFEDDDITPTQATAPAFRQPTTVHLRAIEEHSLPSRDDNPSRVTWSPAPPIEEAVEGLSLVDSAYGTVNNRLHIQIPASTSPGPSSGRSQHSPRTPRGEPRTPQSAVSTSSPISSQETPESDYNDWVERPTFEKLYRDIDKYLPGHDLDEEILVEPPPVPTASPAARRLQGRKKSVRVIMSEAHRNWKQAYNVIKVNQILRRRSTKMWGQKVEQVKPGMVVERVAQASLQPGEIPEPTKMQWMRGELIGKGSFGRVYHALNVAAGEWIAVKQVDLPSTKSDKANPELREHVDAIYREITLLSPLSHDNIVQYLGYDSDEEEGHLHIFLEYVPGGSIASVLSKSGRFDERLVRFFTRQILLGLEYLHDRNILHRDIKAGNILLDLDGTCKITDFGLSKPGGQDKAYDPNSQNSVMRGTVFWMAPEVVTGTNYSAKIDIWSIGCTVIEMLSGKHPWLEMNTLAALYNLGRYQAPPIPEDISEQAQDFLRQCFIIDPVQRPTAADLLCHPFVRQDSSFKFKSYMRRMELARRASNRDVAMNPT
ncbi:hypothetical protein DFQ28_003648 [Apophysomyces sp. BC1034]|nr:hypothetical protein DFQ30_001827 [Apophysomyces sp. BC1015]KAG0182919.1 hypothetical protein DFQ29_001357 [Apophysomyces sp. BC1021]KAG0193728.1 hypothetical protein DFQ28_003648 [Apophysomyces sp. BC1034]